MSEMDDFKFNSKWLIFDETGSPSSFLEQLDPLIDNVVVVTSRKIVQTRTPFHARVKVSTPRTSCHRGKRPPDYFHILGEITFRVPLIFFGSLLLLILEVGFRFAYISGKPLLSKSNFLTFRQIKRNS